MPQSFLQSVCSKSWWPAQEGTGHSVFSSLVDPKVPFSWSEEEIADLYDHTTVLLAAEGETALCHPVSLSSPVCVTASPGVGDTRESRNVKRSGIDTYFPPRSLDVVNSPVIFAICRARPHGIPQSILSVPDFPSLDFIFNFVSHSMKQTLFPINCGKRPFNSILVHQLFSLPLSTDSCLPGTILAGVSYICLEGAKPSPRIQWFA